MEIWAGELGLGVSGSQLILESVVLVTSGRPPAGLLLTAEVTMGTAKMLHPSFQYLHGGGTAYDFTFQN